MHALVTLLFEAWSDLDRVLNELEPADALAQPEGGSSFAWTYAHLANQMDRWFNVRFQSHEPHPLIGLDRFSIGGTGEADDWDQIRAGVKEVRAATRVYLQSLSDAQLETRMPYDGSILEIRPLGISVHYALAKASTHHYFHIGEIATKRAAHDQAVGDYPGPLLTCLLTCM
jgi:hypothetical protein